jgi:hypothetical protein
LSEQKSRHHNETKAPRAEMFAGLFVLLPIILALAVSFSRCRQEAVQRP